MKHEINGDGAMLLTKLVEDLTYELIQGSLNIDISSIAYDSRKVEKNGLFVAVTGFTVDGHRFINNAIAKGAKTVIVEKDVWVEEGVTVLKVPDSRAALAKVSVNFYNHPTEKLNLIGITGTNGKTSTSFFLKSILDVAEKSNGVIGTIGTFIQNEQIKNNNTTPESLNLQQIFSKMVKEKIENCIMEVSSHSISLNRVAYSQFNTAIFTNLSPDHLELHHSMEEYFLTKAQLFQLSSDYNVINIDDEYGARLAEIVEPYKAKLITYGLDNRAHIQARHICQSENFTEYECLTPSGSFTVTVNIPGIVNVYNSLAAISCAYLHQIPVSVIQKGIASVTNIKGRFEVIYHEKDKKVVIDFAHTEDGLQKALETLRPFTKGRLIVVFGVYAAPGKLGEDKRRAMGKVAARYADFSVVTSDNPKEQDPNAIINEIVAAMEEENGNYAIRIDRKEAIIYALQICQPNDTVLLAGKGHETSQVIGKEEIPFNEKEIVLEYFSKTPF
ncbi:UDP-N-acetylmuramoyl-L-alanyl-D-glutamate--2,6-diaminopimelate ligase [Bacillus kwashiorkori]|uniref:UDP-N-acetylmuramoyl-L-alanyl-D-glutamate--2, 6-diaminopimelate ligase n=1 Tax=Bacillus kwashiorkori TaxID=1522318 RepID=UPI000A863B0D|nr:UDP-N-acetylmuramoyl-L-alanyl-D-glutamate--2,6-diaminopimelate ligase [Bacillus kwashiorkori]